VLHCLLCTLQYVVKRQYEDFVIQTYETTYGTDSYLEIFAVSDLPQDTAANLTVSMVYLSGSVCPAKATTTTTTANANTGPLAWSAAQQQLVVPANNAALMVSIKVDDLLRLAPDCTPGTCYIRVEGEAAAVGPAAQRAADGKLKSSSDHFFMEFKNLELQKPSISLSQFTQVGGSARRERGALRAVALCPLALTVP
jgi:hypothetical protein